jgi:hypothetical protein
MRRVGSRLVRRLLPLRKYLADRQLVSRKVGLGGFLDQKDSGGGAGVLCDRPASITRILSANASASCKVLKSPMRFVPDGPVTLTWKPFGSVPVTS